MFEEVEKQGLKLKEFSILFEANVDNVEDVLNKLGLPYSRLVIFENEKNKLALVEYAVKEK